MDSVKPPLCVVRRVGRGQLDSKTERSLRCLLGKATWQIKLITIMVSEIITEAKRRGFNSRSSQIERQCSHVLYYPYNIYVIFVAIKVRISSPNV